MSQEFVKRWDYEKKESLGEKIKEVIYPSQSVKFRIEQVIRLLDIQKNRLEQLYTRLHERDRRLFEYVVNYYLKHDLSRANVYANEIANIRKLAKVVMQSKLALEAIKLRLDTVKDMGDITVAMLPATKIIKEVKAKLVNIMPEAENELTEIQNAITGVLTEVGHTPTTQLAFETSSDEAERIMNEAKAMAERKLKETFVEIPSTQIEKEKESLSIK
ncbi:MAG: Snf7 family protein [Thermoproteota archaeon]|jgi:division protein CdvB (Snf7/Vps24/ESCRT-III family)